MNLTNFFNTDTSKRFADTFNHDESRSTMVASIANLKDERADKLKPLNSELQRANDALEDAQQQLLLAQAQQHTADSKLRLAAASYSHQISRIEKELVATAPEVIDNFCDELNEDARKLRSKGFTRSQKLSNVRSFNARLQAMREAVIEAESFKLLPATDIDSRLQALRDSIPALIMQ